MWKNINVGKHKCGKTGVLNDLFGKYKCGKTGVLNDLFEKY